MNKPVEELVSAISELDSVKRLQELEHYIDSNEEIKVKLNSLLDLQKQMMNAKHLNLLKSFHDYKIQYHSQYEEFLNVPFMEEYLELLDENHLLLKNIFKIIEDEVSIDINK